MRKIFSNFEKVLEILALMLFLYDLVVFYRKNEKEIKTIASGIPSVYRKLRRKF